MNVSIEEEFFIGKILDMDFELIRRKQKVEIRLYPITGGIKNCFSFHLDHKDTELLANKLSKVAEGAKFYADLGDKT